MHWGLGHKLVMTILDRVSACIARLRVPAKVAEPDAPLTIEALHTALNKVSDEHDRQLTIIDNAEAEREAILDAVDGDHAQVLAIDGRIALARVAIERLQRLEEEAYRQLGSLEEAGRQRRWDTAVAEYVTLARDVHAAMEMYEMAANALWASRAGLFNSVGVPNLESRVPRLPQFMKSTPAGPVIADSFAYGQEIERFARARIDDPPVAPAFAERRSFSTCGKFGSEGAGPVGKHSDEGKRWRDQGVEAGFNNDGMKPPHMARVFATEASA